MKKKMMKKIGVTIVLLVMMICAGCAGKSMKKEAATDLTSFGELNSLETVDMLNREKDLLILDVRSVKEQKTKHDFIKGALMIPEQELPKRLGELEAYKERNILVACP